MIASYLQIAFRNIFRNKGFACLNILGFSLGLSAFLLILFFVTDELRYDRYNSNYQNIFRVDTELKYGGATTSFAIAAPPVAKALADNFPEVDKTVRLTPAMNLQFKKGDEIIVENRGIYADESLFDIFSFTLLDGKLEGALANPGSVVLTQRIALKYFNTTQAAGKTLVLSNDNSSYQVAAVVGDMPGRSHFHADILLPLISQDNSKNTNFNQFTFNTYVLLKDGRDYQKLNGKLPAFINKHLSANMDVAEFEKNGNYIRIGLTPIADIHLHSNKQRELEGNSDILYVYIFSAIAALILALACINFTNLFTARSANRAKEVGVRKVLGTGRGDIMLQFLIESFIMTLVSVVISIVIAGLCLPLFNTLSGKDLRITTDTVIFILPFAVIITFIVAILSGIYPAFFLSAFQPVNVLKGKLSTGFRNSGLRNVLVVFQFAIATFLVVSTMVILHQLKFIQNKHLGFNREQVLIVNNVSVMNDPEIIKNETRKLSAVVNASLSGYLPTGGARWQNSIMSEGGESFLSEHWLVDADYIPTLEMDLVQGRNFQPGLATDSTNIIINETAAGMLGYTKEVLDKTVNVGKKRYKVVGVVKDFNFISLRENVTPLVMLLGYDWRASLVIRTKESQLPDVLDQIEQTWSRLNPGHPFEFSFMDKDFEAIYATEKRMEKVFLIFASLAIIIAGIGLFGLSAYAAEQRMRELSIRKVLGASALNIFNLLSFDFIKLVVIAVSIAIPLSWFFMEKWLEDFAYRVSISGIIFLLAAIATLVVAGLTVALQTWKAALANPVKNLRND